MNDLQKIKQLEDILNITLKQVSFEDLTKKNILVKNTWAARNYCTDKSGNVTGLSLDFCGAMFLCPSFKCFFEKLQYLSIKNTRLPDYSFLSEFKELTMLDLSYSHLTDVSFLKELEGLTYLNLSFNHLTDVSFLKELEGLTYLNLSFNQLTDFSFLKELEGLTSLSLRNNHLTDFSFLKELEGLTTLDLRNNHLTDFSFLKELEGLTTLDLRNNHLTDFSFLKELEGLTSLDLSSTFLTDVSFLKELEGLTGLNLSSNELTDVSSLKELEGLTELYLSSNELTDVSFLKELEGLTSLDLSSNELTDVSFLKELEGLTELNLSFNQITDFSFLKKLEGLTSLSLRNNHLTDVSFLKELEGLTTLYLSSNHLTDVSSLKELEGLTELYLSSNELTDVSFLKELEGLTCLYLSSNHLTDVSFLKELEGLTYLDLSFNQLTDVSFLKELEGLTSLDLSNNQLTDVSFLKKLEGLTSLDLSNNHLTDVSFLKKLEGLTELNLSFNQITDVSSLKELEGLTSLDLRDNHLTDVSFLKELEGLTWLYLSSNQITDVSSLKELEGLTSLDLRDNHLTDVSFLKELEGLTELNLSFNQITDVSSLKELEGLTYLYLSDNKLTDVPGFIMKHQTLEELYLYGNPIENIEPEILGKHSFDNCLQAVRDYYSAIEKYGSSVNRQVKLLLLGNGRVGKTSIAERLTGKPCNPDQPSTHAIQISKWSLRKEDNTVLDVRIWDFGGQDIYHGTHRLFMRNKTLYLLVWDSCSEYESCYSDEEGHTFEHFKIPYWLHYIRAFSPRSKVILVQNKTDKTGGRLPDNSSGLEKQFEIAGFVSVSAYSGNNINALQHEIKTTIEDLPDALRKIPNPWMAVRDRIETLARSNKSISMDAYKEICREEHIFEISPTSWQSLLDFLHNTGTLYYEKNLFENKIILDQQWALEAIYTLFDREKVYFKLLFDLKGIFTSSMLEMMAWKDYSIEEQNTFLRFMQSAELCFKLPDSENAKEIRYIVPQLLPAIPGEKKAIYWEDGQEDGLYFVYRYKFYHSGIMHRFIARTGKLVKNAAEYYRDFIVVRDVQSNAKALIEHIQDNTDEWADCIKISVKGNKHKEFLDKICNEFKELNENATIKTEVSLDNQNFVDFESLKEHRDKDMTQMLSKQSGIINPQDFKVFYAKSTEDSLTRAKDKPISRNSYRANVATHKAIIKELIANDEIEKAIDELARGVEESKQEDLSDYIMSLSARFYNNEKLKNSNEKPVDGYSMERTKITNSLTQYLRDYKPSE